MEKEQTHFSRTTEDIVFYAFRYALGRKTSAVSEVVGYILNNWQRIKPTTQDQMKDEIGVALMRGQAGSECDEEEWQKIMERI